MRELLERSTRLVVMTERGRSILQEVYRVPPAKIDLIPHGIPDVPFAAPDSYKDQFGLGGRTVLLTFGLLSPNKGIENVLNALPDIMAEHPNSVYVLLGATHPNELRTRGEDYRCGLQSLAQKQGVENSVVFHNRFVDLKELTAFIGAADLYITPYLDEAQITSGTLAYAFGAGKAVISTPYWHAAELLRGERGVLVPFGDPRAIAREVNALLRDETRLNAMRASAYKLGREMIWSKIAGRYMRSFESARRQSAAAPLSTVAARTSGRLPYETPGLNLKHLYRMTDATGVFQHAKLIAPDPSEGYCTDDNARALILTVLLGQLGETPQRVRVLAARYLAFLNHAYNRVTSRFHNFLSSDQRWLDDEGSEDCHGRAIWALGTAVGRSTLRDSQTVAESLFVGALPAVVKFTSPRAWAFGLIGIQESLRRLHGHSLAEDSRDELTRRLVSIFDKVAKPGWCWFEDGLSYDNAKLAHALIVSGHSGGQPAVRERGLRALRWLVGVQTAQRGQLRPIGSNGFYKRNGARAVFDQQPIEAQATVSACLEAYRATADPWWHQQAQSAFDWFLGRNDLGLELYSRETGGCRDGLHADRSNENQGAESLLAFLLSLAEIRLVRHPAKSVQRGATAASISQ
jgi:hypothetical protein